jgi:cell volume regulation protein A
MSTIETLLLIAATLLLVSVLASKASDRLGIPALLIFLVLGMLAGSDGPGGIYFDDAWTSQFLGVVALALILFAGGLDTNWESVRPVLRPALLLSTIGVALTALVVGSFAVFVLDFTLLQGLLLGAIVSSTDAAAVFSVLRARSASLRGNLKPLLELESGSNDPMAVFLTVALVRLLADPDASVADVAPFFVQQMAVGGALGYGMGRAAAWLVNHLRLEYEGLYPVLTLSLVLLTYALTASAGGNGFLAVYIAGIVLGNSRFIHKASLVRFHDGLAWLMQITMFLTLGLLVFPSRLPAVAMSGLAVSLFLLFIGRPVAVFVTLAFGRFTARERAMVAWVGLRGAVPIVLATFPLLAGVPNADTIFNVVFFIVLVSVLVQGTTLPLVARLLGAHAPMAKRRQSPIEIEPLEGVDADLVEFVVPPSSPVVGRSIVEIGLPAGSLIVLICRGERFFVPSGKTVFEPGDVVQVLANPETARRVGAVLAGRLEPSR